jgi:hypothetical protein
MNENKPIRFLVGDANLEGTHLQGYAPVPFSRVVEVFGEPRHGDYKVAFEWAIVFADGTVASIYDYKASSLYGEPDAPTPEQMRAQDFSDWHVGGKTRRAYELVCEVFGLPISKAA